MKGKAVGWDGDRLKLLKDLDVAREYIEACIEEGIPLPLALADVVKAQGMTQIARKSHMALPNLMRAVKKGSNPTYDTLSRLLTGMGMGLTVRPLISRRRAKAASR